MENYKTHNNHLQETYGSIRIKYILYRFIIQLLILYIIFNILGLNYNRRGIAYQTGITRVKYTKEELQHINGLLLKEVNICKQGMMRNQMQTTSNQQLFKNAVNAYRTASVYYPFLKYNYKSVKPSFFGLAGNYLGFSGYYNPFQRSPVNTTIPEFCPYVVCQK